MKMPLAIRRSAHPAPAGQATESSHGSSRDELLAFLINPHSYPHRPREVRLIQTHASLVFVAAPYVYKVKKPVNFGFLNFSTLEKRRHFCEREVSLNRRLSPGIYLGVVPISMSHGRLTFSEGGEVVEYAVQMRKLPERGFLDRLVERNDIVPGDLKRIVAALKQFYQAQHPTEEIEAWGRVDRLRISTDENFRQTREFLDHTLSRAASETIRSYTDRFYARHLRLFASRVRKRCIRDCHGDLHLDHIHITPRTLHIYDCIEFNDRFRYVDVASDVAFLAMDLDFRGRPDLARSFATQMASALDDDDMPRLIDFYKCYRAYVRGKVESLHSLAPAAPEEERRASVERAKSYFRLALQYTVAGSAPMALVVMGRIASGKSTVARALGVELGWEVYSSDYIRKKMAGFPLYERSPGAARKRLYSSSMTRQTYERLLSTAGSQLANGRCVILDATFARPAQRRLLAERMSQQGVLWRVIEVTATIAETKKRLRNREAKPDEVSDARLEDLDVLSRLYEPWRDLPAARRVKVRTAGPLVRTVTNALRGLAELQVVSTGRPPRSRSHSKRLKP